MNRGTKTFLAMLAIGLLAVIVFFVFEGGEKVYATPQEVFEASKAALAKNDMRGWCQCLTDDARDLIAGKLAVSEFATKQQIEKTGTEEQKAKTRAVDEVFKQHGLTPQFLVKVQDEALALMGPAPMKDQVKIAQVILAPVDDRNGFVADMFKTLMRGAQAENPLVEELKDAVLSGVTIEGKMAKGEIRNKQGSSPLVFRKQGEGWRIDLFAGMDRPPPPMPGMPPGFKHP